MDYQQLIRSIREQLFLSQSELAEKLEVSYASVSRWESGKFDPTIKAKKKIFEFCKENNIKMEDKS